MPADVNSANVIPLLPRALTAAEREELRLDRLRELRATIEALRHEQTSRDPLLAWVLGQDAMTEPDPVHGD